MAGAFEVIRDVFAVVGAASTAAGLGWRIYAWRHDHSPHIGVKLSNGFPTYGANNEHLGEWCFLITAVNHGDHPVRVTSAGLLHPNGDDSTLVIMQPPFPGALPKTIAPRDSGQTWVERSAVESRGVDTVEQALIGWVDLSTGERITSKPVVLVAADKKGPVA